VDSLISQLIALGTNKSFQVYSLIWGALALFGTLMALGTVSTAIGLGVIGSVLSLGLGIQLTPPSSGSSTPAVKE
jgi:hypothetical protein